MPEPSFDDPRIRGQIAQWAEAWNLPGLGERVTIRWNTRLRRTLGRSHGPRRLVELAPAVSRHREVSLDEILCHELAHVAVFELYGPGGRAHGPEWRRLVRAAGFEPRARIIAAGDETLRKAPAHLFLHRCPVCQVHRIARRAMRRWRCTRCLAIGLDGRLEITRRRADGAEEIPDRA